MRRRLLLISALSALSAVNLSAAQPPNIIFLLADDMGYGDLSK